MSWGAEASASAERSILNLTARYSLRGRTMIRMPPTPRLETERLSLRPLALDDAPAIQRAFPRWEIVEFLGAQVPWPYPADGALNFVSASLQQMERGEKSKWALRLKNGPSALIGMIELWPPDPTTRDSRGFWLDPEFQGRGLMTEGL